MNTDLDLSVLTFILLNLLKVILIDQEY